MGYAFFGGAAEGLSDSIDRIGAIVDRRVEMEQGIEAVKLSNELNVAYEQSWMKAQENDPLDGNFVQRQSQAFDTLKSQYLNNIKNKNVRAKFEALAVKDKGNYMSKSALWETEAKRVRIKQDAMDIESVAIGQVSVTGETGDIELTFAKADEETGRMSASWSPLTVPEQIKLAQEFKDKASLAGSESLRRKIEEDFATGKIDMETAASKFDALEDYIKSPKFTGSSELRQTLMNQVSSRKATVLEQFENYNKGIVSENFNSYLDLVKQGKAQENPEQLNKALKIAKTADEREKVERTYKMAVEAGKAATSVLNGDISSVSNIANEFRRQGEEAASAGRFKEAEERFQMANSIQQGGAAMIKAIKEDPAGTAIANDAILQQDYESGDKAKFFRGLFAKFGTVVSANKLMPIPASEKARLVSTLVNGSPDEVGRAIKGLESWNIKTDLLKDDTTPMDIIINEISKDVIKQTEKTGDRSALALLWYGDNDLKRGTLMKYLKTPISADNSSLKKEEVNKAIEKVIKPYVLGFEKQADLAGGAGNWIVANKDIVRGLAYQIAELNPSMKGKASEAVAEAMRLTIQDKYVTQNKGSNSVTIQKEYASEGYLSFLGDKNKQTSYALSNLFGKKIWEGIHTASQRGDEFGGFGKFIKDDVMKNLKLEATKRGINTDNLDLENIGVTDSLKKKTLSDTGVSFLKNLETIKGKPELKAYPDAGRFSIGFGTISYEGEVITAEEAEKRFREDIKSRTAAVDRIEQERISKTGKGLNQKQYDALISFIYNHGEGEMDSLRSAVIRGSDAEAEKLFRKYNKSKEKGELRENTTLVRRRSEESYLYAQGTKELDAVVKLTPEQEKLVNLREEVTSRVIETAIRDKGNFRPVGNTGRARLYVNYMIPGLNATKAYPLPIGRESGNFKYFEVDAKTAGSYAPPPKLDKTTVGAVQNATKVLEMFQGW
ncbi:Glycoside hydrolase, family 24 [uncultured Caudovirales phage]|uniref:Lysozyme n=1 Tax=uncultured Caudovirales phage TaxID=2100421 RepID=A0A6J5MDF0_9CAUD|nr:Glycoside hydrolase, family 24 [uncultured Caudovirales phage]